MRRKKSAYIAIAATLVIACAIIITYLSPKGGTISMKNNTDKDISGLIIKYSDSTDTVNVPIISQKEKYKTKVVLPENFSEGCIKVCYIDKQGKNHEEYLEGYIEKGYNGKVTANINSIDDNGVLSIKVDK